jgi:hypothetical protein
MKKYLSKIVLGSALCASSLAFAGESAPLVLSEVQMDSVTAGNYCPPPRPTSTSTYQRISQSQGNTNNVSISPTVGANLAVLSLGSPQTVGSYTTQAGGTQVAGIK